MPAAKTTMSKAMAESRASRMGSWFGFHFGAKEMEVARALVEAGGDVDARAKDGSTAAMQMAEVGNVELLGALIAAGADLEAQEKFGSTALMRAALGGQLPCLERLIAAGAKLDARSRADGSTALAWAAGKSQLACVEALLAAGADPTLADHDGERPSDRCPATWHGGMCRDKLREAEALREAKAIAQAAEGARAEPADSRPAPRL